MHYSIEDGETFIRAARSSIELCIKSPKSERYMVEKQLERYKDHSGVFVTIKHYPTLTLRGCIGFPDPIGPLSRLIVEAALAAAFEDPRFAPLSKYELDESVIEVSVLTVPEQIKSSTAGGRLKEIKIGRDGLVIKSGFYSGLFLPVVPIEQKWEKEELLMNLCIKAGLPEDAWKTPRTSLFKFTAQVFNETEPSGRVEEVLLEK